MNLLCEFWVLTISSRHLISRGMAGKDVFDRLTEWLLGPPGSVVRAAAVAQRAAIRATLR